MKKKIIPKTRTIEQDRSDIIACAHTVVQMKRCSGGRIIVKGLICIHCHHDPSYGGCNGVTPKIPEREEEKK